MCATLCCALQRCFEVFTYLKLYDCAIAWSEGKRMESKNVATLICSLSILCTANGGAREWSILCNSSLSQQMIKIDMWLFRGSIRDQCVSLFKFIPLKNVRKQNTMISALHFLPGNWIWLLPGNCKHEGRPEGDSTLDSFHKSLRTNTLQILTEF